MTDPKNPGPSNSAPSRPLPVQRAPERASAGAGSAWKSAWWVFLPTLMLLGFAMSQRSQGRRQAVDLGVPEAPDRTASAGPVAGWSATHELPGGASIGLRLEALHPVADRQAFESKALRQHFPDLLDGIDAQPWRLSLMGSPVSGIEGSESTLLDSLADVSIEGMSPLVHPSLRPREGELVDPLVTLFCPPDAPLEAGQAFDLVFWGQPPGEEAMLHLPGSREPLVLRRRSRSATRSSQSIARLDARVGSDGDER